ncbi:MAG: hypothetical protein KDB98_13970, partial [Flavobacteriales bacterium]|nr:hypothetical protein [Flavobacteriales bacterium]
MNKGLQTFKYILFDWLAAIGTWSVFFYYRKTYVESKLYGEVLVNMDHRFIQGLVLIPLFWLLFHAMLGAYSNVYRRSRLRELVQTFAVTLVGVT